MNPFYDVVSRICTPGPYPATRESARMITPIVTAPSAEAVPEPTFLAEHRHKITQPQAIQPDLLPFKMLRLRCMLL